MSTDMLRRLRNRRFIIIIINIIIFHGLCVFAPLWGLCKLLYVQLCIAGGSSQT